MSGRGIDRSGQELGYQLETLAVGRGCRLKLRSFSSADHPDGFWVPHIFLSNCLYGCNYC
jgi:hypothetical protein